MKIAFFLMAMVVVASCSNQQLYDAVQENRRTECQKLPQGQVEECLRNYEKPYEEYARDRSEKIDRGLESE